MQRILLVLIAVWFISCDSSTEHKTDSVTGETGLVEKKIKVTDIIADIDHDWSGCFSGGKNNLKLVYSNGKVKAVLTTGTTSQIAVLDSFKMQSYYKFIKELRALDLTGLCTTTESYSVKTGFEIIRKTDGGCSWNGFNTLTTSLFR
jgi:hypothetical protein